MSKVTIHIHTDNAAFEDSAPGDELGRILRELAGSIEQHGGILNGLTLRDHNGNRVGGIVVGED